WLSRFSHIPYPTRYHNTSAAEPFHEPSRRVALQRVRGVAWRRLTVVGRPALGQEARLLGWRHAAVGVAPVRHGVADGPGLREVLPDAVGDVLGRLSDVDDALVLVGQLVHARHGVTAPWGRQVRQAPPPRD